MLANIKYIIVGNYLRMARERKKLSRSQLARLVDVLSQSVSNWERGQCLPPKRIMAKLLKSLGISKKELINVYLTGDKFYYQNLFDEVLSQEN